MPGGVRHDPPAVYIIWKTGKKWSKNWPFFSEFDLPEFNARP
jgi:hypothetical protein